MLEPSMINSAYEKITLLKELNAFTFEKFVEMSRGWMKRGKLVGFASGNISKDNALQLGKLSKDILNIEEQGWDKIPQIRGTAL
jgi:hypothetical protein